MSIRQNLCCLMIAAAVMLSGCSPAVHTPKLDPYTNANANWNLSQPYGINGKPKPEVLTEVERKQAVRFDPYPDNDIGPKVDGGRPPGYGQQLPESVRSRWVR